MFEKTFSITCGLSDGKSRKIKSIPNFWKYIANNPDTLERTWKNTKEIMTTWGFLLDGKYRENIFDVGVWDYVEKYTRTSGNAPDGLYQLLQQLNGIFFIPIGSIMIAGFFLKKISFSLPKWSPGSYLIRDYARHIVNLEVTLNNEKVFTDLFDFNNEAEMDLSLIHI